MRVFGKKVLKFFGTVLLVVVLVAVALGGNAQAATDNQTTVEQTIQALGIITGDGSGDLNLNGQVTRAQFAKMLVAASTYGSGISNGASGVSPFKDVKYSHWAAGYIKKAVDEGWMVGYVDGTFRPESQVTLEEAATSVIRLLGYTSEDLSGTYPAAQMAKYSSLSLDKDMTAVQGQALTRRDCMQLFYNLMGATAKAGGAYGTTLGYTVNAAGEIDYSELIANDTQGPFIADGGDLQNKVPFDLASATIYRNSVAVEDVNVAQYDVYYYNSNLKTVWVYQDHVTGLYSAATPSTAAPTSVTVGGVSYTIGVSTAAYDLSAAGEYKIGDYITLLMGMNGEVVGVVNAGDLNTVRYGVVQATSQESYHTSTANSESVNMITVACTDGVVRQYPSSNTKYAAGTVVSVSYKDGAFEVRNLQSKGTGGQFSADGKLYGDYRLANNVEILDSASNGSYLTVYPARLAGVRLDSKHVRYYALNANGEVSLLILNDATGDIHDYGIVTSVSEVAETAASEAGSSRTLSGQYAFIINGAEQSQITSGTIYNVEKGPAIFRSVAGKVDNITNLPEVVVDQVSARQLTGTNSKQYSIADGVQVYISKNNAYYLSNLDAVSDLSAYTLKAYYDQSFQAGGLIRVMIATAK